MLWRNCHQSTASLLVFLFVLLHYFHTFAPPPPPSYLCLSLCLMLTWVRKVVGVDTPHPNEKLETND